MRRLAPFPPGSASSSEGAPAVHTLLELASREAAGLRVGSVRLAPGQRVPAEGESVHGVAELSLIVTGTLHGESGGTPFAIGAGEVTLIPQGEPHWAVAGPDGADILWVWFGDVAREA